MVAASFLMTTAAGPELALYGLTLLNIQAIYNKTWNLVALNCASIMGFTYALYI